MPVNVVFVAMLLVSSTVFAPQRNGELSTKGLPTAAEAEAILAKATRFQTGLMPPKNEGQAFNVSYDQPDALARFARIENEGTLAAKLYALSRTSEPQQIALRARCWLRS